MDTLKTQDVLFIELALSGYDGSTDETDNRIVWLSIKPELIPELNKRCLVENAIFCDLDLPFAPLDFIITESSMLNSINW